MYEDQYYFSMCRLVLKAATEDIKGKDVKISSMSYKDRIINAKLDATEGDANLLVPGRDKYTVEIMDGDEVTWADTITLGFGEYKELVVGYTQSIWSVIKDDVNAGRHVGKYRVGHRLTVEYKGDPYFVDVLHVNYKGGSNLVLGFADCLPDKRRMNETKTNENGFVASELCTWLNGEFLESLPQELQDSISDYSWVGSKGGTTALTETMTKKIWLPTEKNVYGDVNTKYALAAETSAGDQFDFFKFRPEIYKTCNGTVSNWWLSSPRAKDAGYNVKSFVVGGAGMATQSAPYADSKHGISPCFMIKAGE